MQGRKSNTLDFVSRATSIHDNFYDYSQVKYTLANQPVEILCPMHGSFFQLPRSHLRGHGCPACGRDRTHKGQRNENNKRKITREKFLTRAKKQHGTYYDYSNVVYVDQTTKVEIICPKHGSFFQSPLKHSVQGTGCPTCGHERGSKQLQGVYSEEYFNNNPEKKYIPAVLYTARFSNDHETFFKVGISTRLKQRFPTSLPYRVEIVETVETTLYDAFRREQKILAEKKQYQPQNHFGGHTECYK